MEKTREIKTKLIFNSYLAKQLLNAGYPIIDILKDHKRKNAVVFVFEETEAFIAAMLKFVAENKEKFADEEVSE